MREPTGKEVMSEREREGERDKDSGRESGQGQSHSPGWTVRPERQKLSTQQRGQSLALEQVDHLPGSEICPHHVPLGMVL